MAIKKRLSNPTNQAIENLANELADKPYGSKIEDDIARTTISLPASLLFKLEDMAINNKRKKDNLKSVSAIIRDCIEKHLKV